jgi:hypothetical protein
VVEGWEAKSRRLVQTWSERIEDMEGLGMTGERNEADERERKHEEGARRDAQLKWTTKLSLQIQAPTAECRLQPELAPYIRSYGACFASFRRFHGKIHTITHYNHNSVICPSIPGRLRQYCADLYRRDERLCDRSDRCHER